MPPIDKPLELAEWPSLDEIKNLVDAHWRALAIAEEAYKALSPAAQRNTRAPGKPPLA